MYTPASIVFGLPSMVTCTSLGTVVNFSTPMLPEVCFGVRRNQLWVAVAEVLEDLEDEVAVAPSQMKQLAAGDVGPWATRGTGCPP